MIPEPASVKLSVVVAASNDLAALLKTLSSLQGQAEAADTEVIAVCNFDGGAKEEIAKQFPFVKCVTLATDTIVPELRAQGIYLSRGEIIALVEDYCTLDERWCTAIKKAYDAPCQVVGGAVENRCPDKPLNWAVYFYDYGKYMAPLQAGSAQTLSGMNVSYAREVLREVQESFREGFYEASTNEELKRRGHQLYLEPSAVTYLAKDYRFRETFRSYFYLARAFAGRRVADSALAKRLMFVLGACVLPILLPGRVVARTVAKRRYLPQLSRSLPPLFALTTSWSAGEFCGYLFGEGTSGRKWM
jgi:glycosyl transferase family 2